MQDKPLCYVASKVRFAGMWKQKREAGARIVSTWIDEAGEGETDSFHELWGRILNEIRQADRLVLHATSPNDGPLKGALIEVGMAIAMGKPVYVHLPQDFTFEIRPSGMHVEGLGTWINSEHVTVSRNLDWSLGLK